MYNIGYNQLYCIITERDAIFKIGTIPQKAGRTVIGHPNL